MALPRTGQPFQDALGFVFKAEGGFADHPSDRGGRTKFGISQRSYPDLDIANLTAADAAKIYRSDYWDKIGGDDLPYPLALSLFDYAVHSGPSGALKRLQNVVGADEDGIWGPQTLSQTQKMLSQYGEGELASQLNARRRQHLNDIATNDPSQGAFLGGWMNRMNDLDAELGVQVAGVGFVPPPPKSPPESTPPQIARVPQRGTTPPGVLSAGLVPSSQPPDKVSSFLAAYQEARESGTFDRRILSSALIPHEDSAHVTNAAYGVVPDVDRLGPVEGFAQTTFESMTRGLIGLDYSPEVEQYTQENPIAGTVAGLTGIAAPFLAAQFIPVGGQAAGIYLSSRIPGLARLASFGTSAEALAARPFAAGAAQALAVEAPVQLGRIGATFAFNEGERRDETLKNIFLFEAPLIGATGAVLGRLAAARPFKGPSESGLVRLRQRFPKEPGLDLAAPKQIQLQGVQSVLKKLKQTASEDLDDVARETARTLAREIIEETPQAGKTHIRGKLTKGGVDDGKEIGSSPIESRMKPGNGKGFRSNELRVHKDRGFKNLEDLEDFQKRAKLPVDRHAYTQFERGIIMGTKKASRDFRKILAKNFQRFASGRAWIAKEHGDGGAYLYVQLVKGRRVPREGQLAKPSIVSGVVPKTALRLSDGKSTVTVAGKRGQSPEELLDLIAQGKKGAEAQRIYTETPVANLSVQSGGIGKGGAFSTSVSEGVLLPQPLVSTKLASPGKMFDIKQGSHIVSGAEGDMYYITRTTRPGYFNQEAAEWSTLLEKNAYILRERGRAIPKRFQSVEAIADAAKLESVIPSQTELLATPTKKLSQKVFEGIPSAAKPLSRDLSAALSRTSSNIGNLLQSGTNAFNKSRRAVRMWAFARSYARQQAAKGSEGYFGVPQLATKGHLAKRTLGTPGRADSIDTLRIAAADDAEAWIQANIAIAEETPLDEVLASDMKPEAKKFLEALFKNDEAETSSILAVEDFVNVSQENRFMPLQFHYGVSRMWRGRYRVKITNEEGSVVAYGGGHTSREAIREADRIVEETAKEGVKLKAFRDRNSIIRNASKEEDLFLAKDIQQGAEEVRAVGRARANLIRREGFTPGKFKPRKGTGGFTQILTPDEMKDAIVGNIVENRRRTSDLMIRHMLNDDISSLKTEFPDLAMQFEDRLMSLAGRKVPKEGVRAGVRQLQLQIDDTLDAALGDIPGLGTPSEMIRMANRAMFSLTLAFMDLGYVAINMLQPVQTLMPEIAYQMGAHPRELERVMSTSLVHGRDGVTRGMSYVEPFKVMRQGWKDMANPDEILSFHYNRAIRDGTIAPKFIEEFAGKDAAVLTNLTRAFSGPKGMGEWLLRANEMLPAMSEELSRGYAFTTAHRLGRQFFGLSDDALYQYATEMTDRAMFLYTASDRPRLITGSFGTLFGLFKNWPLHYTGNLLTYIGAANQRNFAPLLLAGIGSTATAGLVGAPLYGAADGLSKMLSDKALMENMYEFSGYSEGDVALDALFLGLPAFAGVSLAARAQVPTADPTRDLTSLYNIAALDRMLVLGEALGDMLPLGDPTSDSPFRNARVRDKLYRAFLPRTIYRSLSFTERGALKSLRTGNVLDKQTTRLQRFLYTFGIQPVEMEKNSVLADSLHRDQESTRAAIGHYGERVAQAVGGESTESVTRVILDAAREGSDVTSVWRSGMSRLRNRREDFIERRFDASKKRAKEKTLFGK